MRKEDLKYGNVVEFESGSRYIYTFDNSREKEDKHFFLRLDFVSAYQRDVILKSHINSDLVGNEDSWFHKGVKIMKVYEDYTCKEVLWERKEIVVPEINELEKKILGALPFKYNQWYIARDKNGNLFIYKHKPIKCLMGYITDTIDGCEPFTIYNSYFNYIKFGDEYIFRICDLYGRKVLGSCNE